MRYKVKRISPVQSAKVMAVLSLAAMVPFFVISFLMMLSFPFATINNEQKGFFEFAFYGMMLAFPIFACLISAVMGAVIAAIYNFTYKFTGGLEIDLAATAEKDLTDFDK